MRVEFTYPPSKVLPSDLKRAVSKDIREALNSLVTVDDKFIVNDTAWRKNPTKGNRIVVNQAPFITNGLERYLDESLSWIRQKKIDLFSLEGDSEEVVGERGDRLQRFDAYKVFMTNEGMQLKGKTEEAKILSGRIHQRDSKGLEGLASLAFLLETHYRDRKCFALPISPDLDSQYFKESPAKTPVRVALEIETGNIASSFRSIYKLSVLFRSGEIDVGVLVTSKRKDGGATSIWPPSNRNGSLEELEKRCAFKNLDFPLILVGFMPDGIDESAPYLRANGTTYRIDGTATTKIGENTYRIGRNIAGKEIYTLVLSKKPRRKSMP